MEMAADERNFARLAGALPDRVLAVPDRSASHLVTVVDGVLTKEESAAVADVCAQVSYDEFTDETTMRMKRAAIVEPAMLCDVVLVACSIVAMMLSAMIASYNWEK